MEQAVSRAQLESGSSSPASSLESTDLQDIPALPQLDFVQVTSAQQDQAPQAEEDDELEFRLFATQPTGEVKATQNVRIRSPTPDVREPGFLQPSRPSSYYFTGDDKHGLDECAVSEDDLKRLAKIQWTGTAYPWKVLSIPFTSAPPQDDTHWSKLLGKKGTDTAKRRKPGKKARMKLRIKLRAAEAQKSEAKQAQEARDAADREKKTRKNREKKAKKRQRDKAKKLESEGGPADAEMADVPSSPDGG